MSDSNTQITLDYPIACRLEGSAGVARVRDVAELFREASTIEQTEAGYVFRFPGTDDLLNRLSTFVTEERHCCPFLDFELHVPVGGDTVSLHLSGGAGVQEFVAATFVPAALVSTEE